MMRPRSPALKIESPPPSGSREDRSARFEAVEVVRRRLREAVARAEHRGMPAIALDGHLLRPMVAVSAIPTRRLPDLEPSFWDAVLAIQMAHEASLLHDDIIDGASVRRGRPSVVAASGVARALVAGDHLLTGAYRMAAQTGSSAFMARFAEAVERTVAGEIEQAKQTGKRLDADLYHQIVQGKSGELIGCALSALATLDGARHADDLHDIGRRIGGIYQMLDDLLDYCPATDTGKPALSDYRQRRWTWVLGEAGDIPFDLTEDELLQRLHGGGAPPIRGCLEKLKAQCNQVMFDLEMVEPNQVLGKLLDEWLEIAKRAVDREEQECVRAESIRSRARDVVARRLPALRDLDDHFAANSRSFHFASRFFPAEDRGRIARIYAWCRLTDDLVDRPAFVGAADSALLLDVWRELSFSAYHGKQTGLPLLDSVMREMAEREIPFEYASELIEGMRMDLRIERYRTFADLRSYTYRVASVVGLWITEMVGVRRPEVLERAASLGHAMQLTNIARDVGTDLRTGRLYLPLELLASNELDEDDLVKMVRGVAPIDRRYRSAIETLLLTAEEAYREGGRGMPALPQPYRKPVAVAAAVYRGIHGEIRRRGYDNLSTRARTGPMAKLRLTAAGIAGLWAAERRQASIGATPLRVGDLGSRPGAGGGLGARAAVAGGG